MVSAFSDVVLTVALPARERQSGPRVAGAAVAVGHSRARSRPSRLCRRRSAAFSRLPAARAR
eukprot:5254953-Alexandrium_andersonii.AAC.1